MKRADIQGLSDAEVLEGIRVKQSQMQQLQAEQALLLQEFDRRKVWRDDGSKAGWARLMRMTGLSRRDAQFLVKRALRLESMPLTFAAFASGKLSSSRVDLLVAAKRSKVQECFERDEAVLLEQVQSLPLFIDAAKVVKYWSQLADPEGTERDAKAKHDARRASAARTLNDCVSVDAWLDPVAGEIYVRELRRLEEQLFKSDWAEAKERVGGGVSIGDLQRSSAQRRADAMVVMATRSASYEGGTESRPLISIGTGMTKFDQMCQLSSGVVVTPGQVAPYLDHALVERIVYEGNGRVLDISKKRLFTGALRRAIQFRDEHCQDRSGCEVPADDSEVDHIDPSSNGGQTVDENGQCLCGFHNRRKGDTTASRAA